MDALSCMLLPSWCYFSVLEWYLVAAHAEVPRFAYGGERNVDVLGQRMPAVSMQAFHDLDLTSLFCCRRCSLCGVWQAEAASAAPDCLSLSGSNNSYWGLNGMSDMMQT